MQPLASVIMSTYNAVRHLELALMGLLAQSETRFELHVADDGSAPETARLIEKYAKMASFPIVHSWHPDEGYRKSKILNEAIRKATSDYLIFIDGDCIAHRDYVRNHLAHRESGRYLVGRRVDLGPRFSASLTPSAWEDGMLSPFSPKLLLSVLQKDTTYWHRCLPVYGTWLRRALKMDRIDDLRGCNFSVDRESVFKINGFDESYEGYAREDADLELRMRLFGLKIKSLKGLAIQYHVWHERLPEDSGNKARLNAATQTKDFFCKNGLEPASDGFSGKEA